MIFGTGGDIVRVGPVTNKACPVCEKTRPFQLTLQYRFGHVLILFGFVTQKTYLDACTVCNRGQVVSAKLAERALGRVPVPFFHRFGWILLAVPVAVLFLGEVGRSAGLWQFDLFGAIDKWATTP